MARFILLNGPPGIGKSTLAQRYADDHPGTLNLDVDQLRSMIGGWRDRFAETGHIVRPLALGMAETHLRGGRDVIMPQYLGRVEEIERAATMTVRAGAAFAEIVLMDTKQAALRRFAQRGTNDPHDDSHLWHRYVTEHVHHHGGDTLLAQMYDDLTAAIAARTTAVVVPTIPGTIEQSYLALRHALATHAAT
ncbi:MAG TPA: AAA family ATPase [Pseudonocardia sp.]|jgi:predicted kinase|uniref:AAA family ATPase n=1 Tax=Pseudonocardia sp. TaxID=60912 RepID=UPI002F414E9D